jgi:hypothetical protein
MAGPVFCWWGALVHALYHTVGDVALEDSLKIVVLPVKW